MSKALQNTIYLLLPAEIIADGLLEHERIEIRFQHFLEAINHLVNHDGVVMDPDHKFFAFAHELEESTDGLNLLRSSDLDQTLYPEVLPTYLLVPDQKTNLGVKYSEFLQELTSMKEDCCLALLGTFFNLEGESYLKISGEIHLLKDNRLVAHLQYQSTDEAAFFEMLASKGIDVNKYRISVDIAESLAETAEAGYGF